MRKTSSIIEVAHLVKRFKDLAAVDDISFTVEAGEIFAFLGPNGAGKSTTIKMLITLLAPTSGTATIDGHDIARHASEVRNSDRLRAANDFRGRHAHGLREPDAHGAALRYSEGGTKGTRPGNALIPQPGRAHGCAGAHVLRRHDPEDGGWPGHAPPSQGAVARRADDRARPRCATERLGTPL